MSIDNLLEQHLLKGAKKDIKKTSMKVFIQHIKKLFSIIDIEIKEVTPNILNLEDLVNNLNTLKKVFTEFEYENHTILNYLNTLLIISRIPNINIQKKYLENLLLYFDTIKSLCNKKNLQNNKKLEENFISDKTFDIVLRLVRKQVDDNPKDIKLLQNFILILFYSGKYFKPLKNEYADIEIIYDKSNIDTGNYLLQNKKTTLLINDNKLKKSKSFNITKGSLLHTYLTKLINIRSENEKTYLFENKSGKKLSRNNLTKLITLIFNKYFDKKITPNVLCDIYDSKVKIEDEYFRKN
tara:strand:- start:2746 stop:3633 length:888 start_codon:yes stop_codon:yes gene_type:complete